MKTAILIALTFITSSYASSNSKESTAWTLFYGRGTHVDGRKKAEDITPTGNAFKGTWSSRTKYFESGFLVRYANLTDEFTYQSTDGVLKNTDLTLALHGGFWPFSFLKLHGGYAFHRINESIDGDFTDTQRTTMETKYRLINRDIYGLMGGADLILLQSKSFQFFANYDFYYLNGSNAHQWEAMAGIRLYLSGGTKVGKGNFFVKLFNDMFMPKDK